MNCTKYIYKYSFKTGIAYCDLSILCSNYHYHRQNEVDP